jgi:hypothetical protein
MRHRCFASNQHIPSTLARPAVVNMHPVLVECSTPTHCSYTHTTRHSPRAHTYGAATGGSGFSDHVNALLVGLDLLKKALKARPALSGARARRRLIMMGVFETQVGPGCTCDI